MLMGVVGTTMHQEDYGMTFHTKEALNNGESLTDTIMNYSEHAILSKLKVSELEDCLSMLDMGRNTAQPPTGCMPQQKIQAAYFTPEAPAFKAPLPPTTIVSQPPHQQGSAQLQQKSGGSRG